MVIKPRRIYGVAIGSESAQPPTALTTFALGQPASLIIGLRYFAFLVWGNTHVGKSKVLAAARQISGARTCILFNLVDLAAWQRGFSNQHRLRHSSCTGV
jgi:hypothetical protein